MSRAHGFSQLENRLLGIALGIALMSATSSNADADGTKLVTTTSYGAESQIETMAVSFYKQVSTPMPHWVPIEDMQQKSLPHLQSHLVVAPFWYMHIYHDAYGPNEDFDGFESGKLYKYKIERWDPNANGGMGDYVTWGQEVTWTQE